MNIADTLYSGYLNVGDTIFKTGWNYSQILVIKLVYSKHLDITDTIFRSQKNFSIEMYL